VTLKRTNGCPKEPCEGSSLLSQKNGDECDDYDSPENTKRYKLPPLRLPPKVVVASSPRARANGFAEPCPNIENNKSGDTEFCEGEPIRVRHSHESALSVTAIMAKLEYAAVERSAHWLRKAPSKTTQSKAIAPRAGPQYTQTQPPEIPGGFDSGGN
jgi:hypothetical protein